MTEPALSRWEVEIRRVSKALRDVSRSIPVLFEAVVSSVKPLIRDYVENLAAISASRILVKLGEVPYIDLRELLIEIERARLDRLRSFGFRVLSSVESIDLSDIIDKVVSIVTSPETLKRMVIELPSSSKGIRVSEKRIASIDAGLEIGAEAGVPMAGIYSECCVRQETALDLRRPIPLSAVLEAVSKVLFELGSGRALVVHVKAPLVLSRRLEVIAESIIEFSRAGARTMVLVTGCPRPGRSGWLAKYLENSILLDGCRDFRKAVIFAIEGAAWAPSYTAKRLLSHMSGHRLDDDRDLEKVLRRVWSFLASAKRLSTVYDTVLLSVAVAGTGIGGIVLSSYLPLARALYESTGLGCELEEIVSVSESLSGEIYSEGVYHLLETFLASKCNVSSDCVARTLAILRAISVYQRELGKIVIAPLHSLYNLAESEYCMPPAVASRIIAELDSLGIAKIVRGPSGARYLVLAAPRIFRSIDTHERAPSIYDIVVPLADVNDTYRDTAIDVLKSVLPIDFGSVDRKAIADVMKRITVLRL